MEIDAFYAEPATGLAKVIWASWFLPALAAVLFIVVKYWHSKSWWPNVAVMLLLVAHVTYSIIAGHLVTPSEIRARWYEPRHGTSDAPKFPAAPAEAWRFSDDPTPPGSR